MNHGEEWYGWCWWYTFPTAAFACQVAGSIILLSSWTTGGSSQIFFIILCRKNVHGGWNVCCLAQWVHHKWNKMGICPSKTLSIQKYLVCDVPYLAQTHCQTMCCLIHSLTMGNSIKTPTHTLSGYHAYQELTCCWLFGDPHSGLFSRMT